MPSCRRTCPGDHERAHLEGLERCSNDPDPAIIVPQLWLERARAAVTQAECNVAMAEANRNAGVECPVDDDGYSSTETLMMGPREVSGAAESKHHGPRPPWPRNPRP